MANEISGTDISSLEENSNEILISKNKIEKAKTVVDTII